MTAPPTATRNSHAGAGAAAQALRQAPSIQGCLCGTCLAPTLTLARLEPHDRRLVLDRNEHVSQQLLDRLVTMGALPEAAAAVAQSEAERADLPVETYLVREHAVPARALVAAAAALAGRETVEVSGELFQRDVGARVALDAARSRGLSPVGIHYDRLYCLTAPGTAPPLFESRLGFCMAVVPVGERPRTDPIFHADRVSLEPLQHPEPLVDLMARRGHLRPAQLVTRPESDAAAAGAIYRAGILEEAQYFREIASAMGFRLYTAAMLAAHGDPSAVARLPQGYARHLDVLPLRQLGDTLFVAATGGPETLEQLEPVRAAFGCKHLYVGWATRAELAAAADQLRARSASAVAAVAPAPHTDTLDKLTGVPQLVAAMLHDALERRASDIHLERYEQRVDVRFRIDGELIRVEDTGLTPDNIPAVVSKLKTLANLDIAERRRPQDGAFRQHEGNRVVDFRLAIQPTIWGENAVLRLLPQGGSVPTLDELGFKAEPLARFRRLLRNPQGLILLTGPTGCGKTTTLNAVLQELRGENLKTVTAEDPVEYTLDGVQQSQVNDAIGNTFEHFLRSFLRQDPDVILCGEIRDAPTAEMALRAAQTGHLVFSTLHVNEAVGVVRRLADLGIEPNLIAQSLLCVVGQRLARRICPRCSAPHEPSQAALAEFFPQGAPPGAHFAVGHGCDACHHTGFRGRLALVELWAPDDVARAEIDAQASTPRLRELAVASGMEPLVFDARHKAAEGMTTLEELRGVIAWDQIQRFCR
jgi:type IV pilus assembly protein PilB